MRAVISWWDLAESEQTIESLREHLRTEEVDPWRAVEGLCLKLWIADLSTDRWGAIMLWESADAPTGPLPPNLALSLIGYPPTERLSFDIEAGAAGKHSLASLLELGPAIQAIETVAG
jgi:hypothetical protein